MAIGAGRTSEVQIDVCKIIKVVFASIGTILGYFIGGIDGFLYTLIAMVTVDYLTGVMSAIVTKTLSSSKGYKGIFHKILIFALVGIGNMLDVYIIKEGSIIRTAVVFYYIANEGISILENCTEIGLPVPKKLKDVLIQLKEREEENVDSNS